MLKYELMIQCVECRERIVMTYRYKSIKYKTSGEQIMYKKVDAEFTDGYRYTRK